MDRPANESNQEAIITAVSNASGVFTVTATDDTTGTALPSQAVADGHTAVVIADPDNAGRVLVGPAGGTHAVPLEPGGSAEYAVENVDALGFTANSDGDGVIVTGEV